MFYRVFSRLFICLILLAISTSPSSAVQSVNLPVRETTTATGPNILLIVSDDQRYDTIDYMPRTKARIFDEGVTFSNAFVTTSLCCPSRASILTGQYVHTHGVRANMTALLRPTFIDRLRAAGYITGLTGKYLNSWGSVSRSEFDMWVSHRGGTYTDPLMNVNGTFIQHSGYTTSLLADYAVQFIEQASTREQPFVLLFTASPPHLPATPAPGDETLYPELAPHRPPSFNETDVSDKPRWVRDQPALTEEQIAGIDAERRKQLQSLNGLDVAVERLMDTLAAAGELDNTLVAYISDNGYLWGEHRLGSKAVVYDEAIRVPMAIRYPPLAPAPRAESRLVANIDLAPTFYELAGLPVPADINGRSLVPVLSGTVRGWRDHLLIEGGLDNAKVGLVDTFYEGIVTPRYRYFETERDRDEFYDLATDPYQLQNKVDNSKYALPIANMRARLARARQSIPPFVHVYGPPSGYLGQPQTFTASIRPVTTTLPLTYIWEAADHPPLTHVGGITDTATFVWDTATITTNFKMVKVTAIGVDGTMVGNQVILVNRPPRLSVEPRVMAALPFHRRGERP